MRGVKKIKKKFSERRRNITEIEKRNDRKDGEVK